MSIPQQSSVALVEFFENPFKRVLAIAKFS